MALSKPAPKELPAPRENPNVAVAHSCSLVDCWDNPNVDFVVSRPVKTAASSKPFITRSPAFLSTLLDLAALLALKALSINLKPFCILFPPAFLNNINSPTNIVRSTVPPPTTLRQFWDKASSTCSSFIPPNPAFSADFINALLVAYCNLGVASPPVKSIFSKTASPALSQKPSCSSLNGSVFVCTALFSITYSSKALL